LKEGECSERRRKRNKPKKKKKKKKKEEENKSPKLESKKEEHRSKTPTGRKKSSADILKESLETQPEDDFSFRRLLVNPQFADVLFLVGQKESPGKVLAHACVIEARCPSLLQNSRKKKNINEIDVQSSINMNTFQEVLNYIYTGSAELSKLKEEEIILLLAACTKYEGLDRLRFLCQSHLRKTLDIKNVHLLLKATEDHDMKTFKEVVLHFAVSNYVEFLANKQGVKDIGINLFQEVVTLHHQGLKPLPEEKEPNDSFVHDFKALYESSKQSDISFQVTEPNALGIANTLARGHKAIVVGRAPGLIGLVNQNPSDSSKIAAVVVKNISPEAFEAAMKWIYFNDNNLSTMTACELIAFCQQYGLLSLQKVCVENVKKNISLDTVLTVLDVTYLKDNMPPWFIDEMELLRPKCIQYASERLKDVNFEKMSKKMNNNIAPDILMYLQKNSK